eukprot:CAMPEP_0178948606 /NCGR_PEP_ID=MMETSP0789-20121207/5575_1 /TAXON_ID=3005 /ORGANISM="Rhizosolenia setigera, Strain CCMP 1694" /LENGTH=426 /DNA_ID=CAMNT_0020629009 /DNA_START=187 /DNA_END=1464 /DNA_ORIENTATION=+
MMSSKTTAEAAKTNTGKVSSQIQETLDPEKKEEIFSLAQGVVYWSPPETTNEYIINALVGSDEESATASNELNQSTLHLYGPVEGSSDLLEKLQEKLKKENGLDDVSIMVTAGANQAYMNCVLTLFSNDESDKGVIFKPYYFNHVMAIQMARGNDALIYGPTTPNEGIPDTQWLEEELSVSSNNIKVVTVVNPGNPTGVSLSRTKIQELVDICGKYNVWLILDNTYEHFDHSNANSNNASNDDDDVPFYCPSEPHVINIFSFSKCFSLAGYRVGYLTISNQNYEVFEQMKKVQDTIPICVSRISQVAALGAIESGRDWVNEKVKTLDEGRDAIINALSPLESIMGGSGAMYVMAKLPDNADDQVVAEILVKDFGVAVIPGSFCGFPNWIRVCYSNLPPEKCKVAASRLKQGIQAISQDYDELSKQI